MHAYGTAAQRRTRRQDEAQERQARHDALSLDEKVAVAHLGSREHTRLLKLPRAL